MDCRFDHRILHVRLLVDQVALEEISLQVLRYSSVSIIPLMFRIHIFLSTTSSRTRGRSRAIFTQSECFFGYRGALDGKVPSYCL
jgi:hypothetical protein